MSICFDLARYIGFFARFIAEFESVYISLQSIVIAPKIGANSLRIARIYSCSLMASFKAIYLASQVLKATVFCLLEH